MQKKDQATFGKFYILENWKHRMHDVLSELNGQNQSSTDKIWLWKFYEFQKQRNNENKHEKGNVLSQGRFTNRISMNLTDVNKTKEEEAKKADSAETGQSVLMLSNKINEICLFIKQQMS